MGFLQVTTAVGSQEEAARITRALVGERLAACVQVVGPILSTYWWKGAIEEAREYLCLVKTTDERYSAAEARIRELHSYETPEITAVPIVVGSAGYLSWLAAETRSSEV